MKRHVLGRDRAARSAALKKLRGKKGFTLTEALAAAAILALLAAVVGTGLSVAMPVYHDSLSMSESAILSSTLSQAVMDELRFAREIKAGEEGKNPTFTSMLYGQDTAITSVGGRILANGKPLLGEGAYTGLDADIAVRYVADGFAVELSVSKNGQVRRQTSFTVCPINTL